MPKMAYKVLFHATLNNYTRQSFLYYR